MPTTTRPTARDETAVDVSIDEFHFAVLDMPSAEGSFISFKDEATHVRINSGLKYRLQRDFVEEANPAETVFDQLFGTYARDQKGRPWLAVTEDPAAVSKDVATISDRPHSLEINSKQLCRVLAAHWAENGERQRLYWTGVREEMGPWTMYLLEPPEEE